MPTLSEIKNSVCFGVERFNGTADGDKRIVRVELFGSYARGNASNGSDIDLLIEFANPHVGLFSLASILSIMEEETGSSVDIVQYPLPQDSLLDLGKTVLLYAQMN